MAKITKIKEVDKIYNVVSFDFSGEELRLFANIGNEKVWQDVFINGGDLHKRMAMALVNNDEEKYNKSVRKVAKSVNFSIMYLCTPQSFVGMELNGKEMNLNDATKMLKDYKNGIKDAIRWQDNYIHRALQKGEASSYFGRPRMLTPLAIKYGKSYALRTASNVIIQGTGADILKIAFIKLFKENIIGRYNKKTRFLCTIHDEINYSVIYYNYKQLEQTMCKIKSLMDFTLPNWPVPIIVDGSYGGSLGMQLECKLDMDKGLVHPKIDEPEKIHWYVEEKAE